MLGPQSQLGFATVVCVELCAVYCDQMGLFDCFQLEEVEVEDY